MFQRARNDRNADQQRPKHVARNNEAVVEDQLNARVEAEVEQLLTSFGEIIQSSRIYNSRPIDLSGRADPRPKRPAHSSSQLQRRARQSDSDSDDAINDDGDLKGPKAGAEATKDKYAVAQEAYGAQTRAATMVRSVEKLLAMVADVRRARLVNDSTTMTAIADARRKALEGSTLATKEAVAQLNAAVDAAVRELETVYHNSKYVKHAE
ncbi:hypothetical protein H4R99_004635 [Coemansia sp. RSA 1722]|nr:hypothetical protein LPJ57_006224 [Coemansia sp. RSA 486]KAJ2597123.1 hypothetical protein H4R99_004635 [Coemansia sp. RSA 1722]KAJ2637866.1 hypothetical protein GGF40_002057 [Coemansia sp. RSA 1286]